MVLFCVDFVGSGVTWSAVTFACLVVRLFIRLFYVCTVRAVLCSLWCGCATLVCEVVLKYVEVGAIARFVVVSVVLWSCVWVPCVLF